jgi:hypothetical protein
MTRAIQQNARSGPAGTVSQPAQGWRQIGGYCVSRDAGAVTVGKVRPL